MSIRAILFDLDGTLLDTLADLADSMNQALAALGFPTHPRDFYHTAVGDGIEVFAERVLPEANRTPATIAKLVSEMQKSYALGWRNQTKPYSGIPTLLAELDRRSIRKAVLSNKPDNKTKECVQHFFGSNTFNIIMGATKAFPLKPDPTAALHIVKMLGIPKQNCLYMGDTNTDMQTAVGAGIRAVGVTWGFRPREELVANGADVTIDKPCDLLAYLDTATNAA